MKRLLPILIGMALVCGNLFAASTNYLIGTLTGDTLVRGFLPANKSLAQITLANAAGSDITVDIYNAPVSADEAADLNFAIGSWTGQVYATTNLVTSFTNFLGVVESVTNTVNYSFTTTFPTNVGTYKKVRTIVVPAGDTSIWIPGTPVIMDRGTVLQVSATNITATIEYNDR